MEWTVINIEGEKDMKTIIKRKYFFSKLLTIVLTIFVSLFLFACKNNLYDSEQTQSINEKTVISNGANKGYVKINLISAEFEKSRTALPEIPSLYNFTDFQLKGIHNEKNYDLGNWFYYDDFQYQYIELEIGEWELTLSAKINEFTFSSTCNIEVELTSNQQVDFVLSSNIDSGGLYLYINFDPSYEVNHVKYQLEKYPSETLVDSGSLPVYRYDFYKSISLTKDNSNPLPSGTYRLSLSFYADVEEELLLNSYSELVRIKEGLTTSVSKTLSLNEIYRINYYNHENAEIVSGMLIENYTINSRYEDIIFPDLSKDGYDWKGWYTLPNGNGVRTTSLPADSTGDKEYYAYFTPIQYTINYELDGGTNHSSNPASYTVEDADISLQNPTKTGFEFDGWYTDSAFTNRIEIISTAVKENLTLYAKWSVLTNVQLLPVFPGNYSCKWSSVVNASNETVITITIRDSSASIVTPDSINVLLCINGEATGSQFSSASFEYPAALQNIAAPGDYSFYVTVEINSQSYSFYAVSE